MKQSQILTAMEEAYRFIRTAEVAVKEIGRDEYIISGTKASGALRRSSLDLTRALAEMRKS